METPKAAEPKSPDKIPGKKPRIKEEVEKERNSQLAKKRPKTYAQKARGQVLHYS